MVKLDRETCGVGTFTDQAKRSMYFAGFSQDGMAETTIFKRDIIERLKMPHATVLPGLQFTLAEIIGKPATFYKIPTIRFIYELLSYMFDMISEL